MTTLFKIWVVIIFTTVYYLFFSPAVSLIFGILTLKLCETKDVYRGRIDLQLLRRLALGVGFTTYLAINLVGYDVAFGTASAASKGVILAGAGANPVFLVMVITFVVITIYHFWSIIRKN